MSGIANFLDGPLVTWVRTFSDGDGVGFQDICDGVYLNDVMLQIDHRDEDACSGDKIQRMPTDPNARLQNWRILLRNIKAFYNDVLQQTVVTPNPDVFALVDDPSKDECLAELETVLLLLLGCAVQGESKARYIDVITSSLDVDTQQAIVRCICKITDSPEHVVSAEMLSADSDVAKHVYAVLRRVVSERDEQFQRLVERQQEVNYLRNETATSRRAYVTPPPTLEAQHVARELQACRSQLSETALQLEEKNKALAELQADMDDKAAELTKAKLEVTSLSKDAALARSYRDQVDVLSEQALRLERYEVEVNKFKQKIHDLDFYRMRVDELKDDNSALSAAKQRSEEQYALVQRRVDGLMQDRDSLQQQIDEFKQERDSLQQRLNEAVEENATLNFEHARVKDGYTGPLRRMVSYTSTEFLSGSTQQLAGHPISDELTDSMQAHVTKLEVENDQLKCELEEIKSKLQETQKELEHVICQSESDLKKRRQEFDKEQTKLRHSLTNDVTTRMQASCDAKVKTVQEQSKMEKRQIVEDYDAKIKLLENENRELKAKLEKLSHVNDQKENKRESDSAAELIVDLQEQVKQHQQHIDELTSKNERAQQKSLLRQRAEFTGRDISNEQQCNGNETESQVKRLVEQRLQTADNEKQLEVVCLRQERQQLQLDFEALQEELAMERDRCDNVTSELERCERENHELKENIETVRECSENHIRSLEIDLAQLQTRAVAMESLNDYLSNLSSAEDGGAADGGMSLQNDEKYEDSHHDVSRDSLRSLPADLQQLHRKYAHNQSMNDADNTYAEICSPNPNKNRSYRSEKISYVKSGSAHKDTKQQLQAQKSAGLLGKLRNYVKPQKEAELRKTGKGSLSSSSSCVPRKIVCDVSMREKAPLAFDRNSRHRHTIQSIKMKETNAPAHTTHLRTPVTHAQSKPVPATFSRDHALRKTMPERRTVYRFPDKRSRDRLTLSRDQLKMARSRDGSHQSLTAANGSQSVCHDDATNSDALKRQFSMPPNPYHARCTDFTDVGVMSDSGVAQSTNASPPDDDVSTTHLDDSFQCSTPQLSKHRLTSIEILNADSVTRHLDASMTSMASPANHSLIDQIVKLQDKNISLTSQNEKLKKSIDAATGDGSLVQKLQKLEAENRKLKMIIETYTISGKIPYDKTEYHYFTNV